ncbi:hypothetical protein CNBF0700 [Cryptococcus deneoformans B-3501A]|uniref:Expressed protein n=1 Tax=Cryptococcus deneoformans (strain JEC21 / ATCC MYA-565) TaxID=214684 RepID=Q5KEV0_CRYD1|nr:expressed protein [Cryptococcus neoformans var. neoformans JEC21]XP_774905.1 hypothetical protein CNBF0700 [Cryptococcus neoformans var. neoformans B-3501A]AAW44386.1 expressed protein [Cryptococcus neoformans var. neoformans JEC21]EAL20258.1 hypothetical protein CNBF0700 [Cryptococcus neoformans var. neoformans B-3501A]
MPKEAKLPSTTPPPALFPQILPLLISRLTTSPVNLQILPVIETALHIQRCVTLEPMPGVSASSLIPLQKLLELSTSHPAAVRVPAIIDAILAHPIHSPVISQIISNVFNESPDSIEIWRIDVLPELINQTKAGGQKDVVLAVKLMLGMIRAHDELIGLTLEVSEEVLRGLSMAYSKLGEDDRKTRTGVSEEIRLGAMEDVLMICKELITRVGMEGAAGDAMLRFLGENESAAMGVMQGKSLRGDCEALWGKNGRKFSPDSVIIGKLEKKRDDLAKLDPRVMSILAIFPTIPPHLLLIALSHPQFSSIPAGSKASPGELAEPLLACMLNHGEGLPEELGGLKAVVSKLGNAQAAGEVPDEKRKEKKKFERRNIFTAEDLDISRLRLKDGESALPELQSTIPQHIRDSIQRLISLQASEEEERRQALADSNLLLSDDESDMDDSGEIPLQVRVSGGDTEDTAPVDSDGEAVKVSRRNQQNQNNGMPDKERYEILRTLYLDDPGLFDRDGVTRRSDERKKMREMLGWDDGQIEGWRVMLERDPQKDVILEAHRDRMARKGTSSSGYNNRNNRHDNRARQPSPDGSVMSMNTSYTSNSHSNGGGRGGKGRQNKGNRGHSNAARTRGHDRKMRQMGA